VLPLENLSGDPAQEYVSDGLTDELISDLSRIRPLRVISRTSSMRYKGVKKALPQIARELNVEGVVEGSVRRSGNRMRINVRLIQAPLERQLWAAQYERDLGEMERLPEQAALAIAHEVSGQLAPADRTRLTRKRALKSQAYDAYLRGRHLLDQRGEVEVSEAAGYFEQALWEDAGFALAWSGLADCYSLVWGSKKDYPRAEACARKALALEPDLAEAHASLGVIIDAVYRFPEAEKELRRAIELNPNYAMAHHWYSLHLLRIGHLTEALAENDGALRLDPFSIPVNFLRGVILTSQRQIDRAVEQAETLAAIDPKGSAAHELLARLYWIVERVPEALTEERQVAVLGQLQRRLPEVGAVAAVYTKSGPHAARLKWAQFREKEAKSADFHQRMSNSQGISVDVALAYAVAGDKERALAWLDKAVRDKDETLLELLVPAPEFDFLRADPRFRDLLRRIGLPQ